ncbi:MAG: hypothetical protein KKC79_12955 [Gammaproteobacteria bacterium]|nr:hypothetical protein [Gammaproteobacteria bacterium]MBU1440543.1 hypothetical protein [Gammaproteobacteria bacterium]MBU2285376.1 hypothetical protein [Gammaproteobacteria bacterium]MBU2409540.1 hypothetical protein [Gammaproteobacteria bacterium]
MPSSLPFSRFANPLMLWIDVAFKSQETFLYSGSVIQQRTERMARAGLMPSDDDIEELKLMSSEKLEAASEAGAAMADQLHAASFGLPHRAVTEWLASALALASLSTSTTPAEVAEHTRAFARATTRTAEALSQLSSVGARMVQRGLKPIHSKVSSNARRLASSRDSASAAAGAQDAGTSVSKVISEGAPKRLGGPQ